METEHSPMRGAFLFLAAALLAENADAQPDPVIGLAFANASINAFISSGTIARTSGGLMLTTVQPSKSRQNGGTFRRPYELGAFRVTLHEAADQNRLRC